MYMYVSSVVSPNFPSSAKIKHKVLSHGPQENGRKTGDTYHLHMATTYFISNQFFSSVLYIDMNICDHQWMIEEAKQQVQILQHKDPSTRDESS